MTETAADTSSFRKEVTTASSNAVETVGLALILPPGAVPAAHPISHVQRVLRSAMSTQRQVNQQNTSRGAV